MLGRKKAAAKAPAPAPAPAPASAVAMPAQLSQDDAAKIASAAVNEASSLVKNAMTQENLEQIQKVAAERFDDINKSLVNGNTPIRAMALAGGAALTFFSATGVLGSLLSFSIDSAVMQVYTLAIGLIMVGLEMPGLKLPDEFTDMLYKYCLFVKFIWGRGILYFIGGTIQFSVGGLFNWIVGGYIMFVGVAYYFVGRSSAKKLSDLKKSLYSESTIEAKFTKVDTKKEGKINLEQFGTLCDELDLDMTNREKEAIFFHLDTSDDNFLTLEEFQGWWQNFDASHAV